MSRTPAEVKDVVTQVKDGFSGVETAHRKRQAQLYQHESYDAELVANLDDSIKVRIPFASSRLAKAAEDIEGILNAGYSWHVEPKGDKTDRARRSADKIELYHANLWSTDFKPTLIATYRDITVSPWSMWWLEWDAMKLPRNASQTEAYRKGYRPFRLMRIDGMSGYFMADDNGKPTVAVREFELPYYEIVKRYGRGKDANPLTILGREFGFLRGGRGQAVDTADLYTKKAKVTVVDDQNTICQYIEGITDRKATYNEVTDEVANPWGRTSLYVIPGRFNPDAERLEDRYMPLIASLGREQRRYDVMRSHMASLSFTANRLAVAIHQEVVTALALEEKALPSAVFKDGVLSIPGVPTEFSLQPGQAAWEMLANQKEERDAVLPSPYLTNPDESVIKNATAAAQLNAQETSDKPFDAPRAAIIQGMIDVDAAIKHFMTGGYLNKGDVGGESLYFNPSGQEPTGNVYAGDYKDRELAVGKDDYEMDYTEEITIVAATASQKALRQELVANQVALGVATHDDLLGEVTENVEGKKKEINEEREFQKLVPLVDNLVLLNSLQTIMAESNINLIPLALQSGVLNPGLLGQQAAPDEGIGGARTDPPATAVSTAAAVGP